MLQFNHKGYLKPGGNLHTNLSDIKATFLANDVRRSLFDKYLLYSDHLKKATGTPFVQWINGSFCTLKREPKDIDVVSFIPNIIIEQDEKLFGRFKYPNSENEFGVDGYIVIVYADNSRFFRRYISDRLYWMDYFSSTKRNRSGNRFPKGFIEIIF